MGVVGGIRHRNFVGQETYNILHCVHWFCRSMKGAAVLSTTIIEYASKVSPAVLEESTMRVTKKELLLKEYEGSAVKLRVGRDEVLRPLRAMPIMLMLG